MHAAGFAGRSTGRYLIYLLLNIVMELETGCLMLVIVDN
jgi:hypothetical protein